MTKQRVFSRVVGDGKGKATKKESRQKIKGFRERRDIKYVSVSQVNFSRTDCVLASSINFTINHENKKNNIKVSGLWPITWPARCDGCVECFAYFLVSPFGLSIYLCQIQANRVRRRGQLDF
jgi:hypothetical protein